MDTFKECLSTCTKCRVTRCAECNYFIHNQVFVLLIYALNCIVSNGFLFPALVHGWILTPANLLRQRVVVHCETLALGIRPERRAHLCETSEPVLFTNQFQTICTIAVSPGANQASFYDQDNGLFISRHVGARTLVACLSLARAILSFYEKISCSKIG
jgi:hypothetical protein